MLKRFPVPEALKLRLELETPLVHQILRGDDVATIPDLADPIEELNNRLKHLQKIGLYYANPDKRQGVTWSDLRIAQAEIACIHGLRYHKDGKKSRWVMAKNPSESTNFESRSENHFTQIFNAGVDGRDSRNLKRIDLALLAHVHQIPIELMEAPDRKSFDAHVSKISGGFDAFLKGGLFLEACVRETPQLVVAKEDEILWLSGQVGEKGKGFVIEEADSNLSEFSVLDPIAVYLETNALEGTVFNAVLVGKEESGRYILLSTPKVCRENIRHTRTIVIPRVEHLVSQHDSIKIDEPGDFEIFLLVSEASLVEFPTYIKVANVPVSMKEACSILDDEAFAWIRSKILTSPIGRYHVFHRKIEVREPKKVQPDDLM